MDDSTAAASYPPPSEEGQCVGKWSVDTKAGVPPFLQHEGLERHDVFLEPGRLYGTAGAWGLFSPGEEI